MLVIFSSVFYDKSVVAWSSRPQHTQKSLSCNGVENHRINVVQDFGSVIVLSLKGLIQVTRCLASRCPYIFKYLNRLSVANLKFGHHADICGWWSKREEERCLLPLSSLSLAAEGFAMLWAFVVTQDTARHAFTNCHTFSMVL